MKTPITPTDPLPFISVCLFTHSKIAPKHRAEGRYEIRAANETEAVIAAVRAHDAKYSGMEVDFAAIGAVCHVDPSLSGSTTRFYAPNGEPCARPNPKTGEDSPA